MKHVFLFFGLLLCLYADINDYSLEKNEFSKEKYFVKFAAFKKFEGAQKVQHSFDFSTNIIHLGKYYSVLSDEFKTYSKAKIFCNQIKKDHKGVYIIKLYTKVKELQKIKQPVIVQKAIPPNKLQKATAFYNAKRYEEALMAFDRILIENPRDTRAKFYYATTLYRLTLYKEARDEFNQLLNLPLEDSSKKEVKKYLIALDKKQKRHFFNSWIGFGVGYDDNINLNTVDKTIKYGSLILNNDTNKTNSTYALASFSLSHRYKADTFNLYTTFYTYNEFFHSVNGNDLNFFDLSTAIVKKYKKFIFSLPIGFNSSYIDAKTVGYNLYTSPTISYLFSKKLNMYTQISFLDNTTKIVKNRDHKLLGGGVGIRYNGNKFLGQIGASLQNVTAKNDVRLDVSRDDFRYFAYGKYYIFTTLYLGANLSLENSKYNNLDTVMGYKREDDRFSSSLIIGKEIYKSVLLNLRYQYTKNDSNINTYSYQTNNYMLECKYKF